MKQELSLEWRSPIVLYSFLLNLFSSSLIVYLALQWTHSFTPQLAVILFWFIFIFNANFSLLNIFQREQKLHYLFYYQLVNPYVVLAAKVAYNTSLLYGLAIIEYGIFTFFFSAFIGDMILFLINLFITSLGVVGIMSLTSAIAQKSIHREVMMTVLSIPLLFPLFALSLKLSQQCLREDVSWRIASQNVLPLLSIDLIVYILAFALIGFVWRG